jgi:hypothetical protein
MSIHYFITPYPPTEWESAVSSLNIDPSQFAKDLLQRWPEATLELDDSGVSWKIPEEESSGFHGRLQNNHQIVTFLLGNRIVVQDFVLWYRNLVPNTYPLYLFNASSWDSFELLISTSRTEMANYFGVK